MPKIWKGVMNDYHCTVKIDGNYGYFNELSINYEISNSIVTDEIIAVIDEMNVWFTSKGIFYTGVYEFVDNQHVIFGHSYHKDEKKEWKLIFYKNEKK